MALGGEYQFVAWTRSGIGALLGGAAADVELVVDSVGTIPWKLAPYASGDVAALDSRAVIRTVPRDGVLDFEPNLFPSVELVHPALPWLVSPSAAGERLTPWIVLVVVAEQDGVALATEGRGRQVLTIDAPATPTSELPDLSQAWAWAHAQTVGAAGSTIDAAAYAKAGASARGRLIAPRRLEPSRRYLACVVPAYAAGVAAALGDVTSADGFAWNGTEASLRLPVFHSWRFATGPGGDFASLAKKLVAHPLDATVGHRTIDIGDPGWGMPVAEAASLDVSGVLRSRSWQPPPTPVAATAIGDAIAAQVDAAAAPPAGQAPVFAPPFYGATATRAETTSTAPSWQSDLNRDVGERIAAGLGGAVVRANQDALVDAAWRAAGDAERANQLLRQGELAAAVTTGLVRRHFAPLDDGELLAVARPLLARVHAGDVHGPPRPRPTIAATIRVSAMPKAALSSSLRRLGRASGPLARTTPRRTGAILAKVDARTIIPVPPKALAKGAAGFDAISVETHERPRSSAANLAAIDAAATHWKTPTLPRRRMEVARRNDATGGVVDLTAALARRTTDVPDGERDRTPAPISTQATPDPVAVDEFAVAARAHQKYIAERLSRVPDGPTPLGSLGSIRAQLERQWTAAGGIAPQLRVRLDGVASENIDTFTPVQITPVLEQPLVSALQALSPEHVLPGVGDVTPNTVGLAISDPATVRAILVGANDELGRELLWRGFPGAHGHTWLRTFWGRVAIDAHGAATPQPDIDPIEAWPPEGPAPGGAEVFLVVRGDVLHRYPNALVYAVPAAWQGRYRVVSNAAPLLPVITATLGTDVALFGFGLSPEAARGADAPPAAPGWYFVIAEHPSEPRFGLGVADPAAPPTWRDVTWTSVGASDLAGNYLRVDGPLAQFHPTDPGGLTWGADAAQIAAITFRRPLRVAKHASTLMG